jgi:hypothetical protein
MNSPPFHHLFIIYLVISDYYDVLAAVSRDEEAVDCWLCDLSSDLFIPTGAGLVASQAVW